MIMYLSFILRSYIKLVDDDNIVVDIVVVSIFFSSRKPL